ncbi:MAG: TetR/AcrR family transcriptional regulator [Acidimicrobiales bacterium]
MGRPRDAAIDGAVMAAARELLAEIGYDGVTMDATAARAGTSKAAIYRRFQSKAELMFAAAVHGPDTGPPPDTGSLRDDLFTLATVIRSAMSSPAAREVAPRVIVDIDRSPDISRRLRDVFVAGEMDQTTTILRRAVDRGELARPPDAAATHRLLAGALFFSVFVVDETPDDDQLGRIVDLITAGLTNRTDRPTTGHRHENHAG